MRTAQMRAVLAVSQHERNVDASARCGCVYELQGEVPTRCHPTPHIHSRHARAPASAALSKRYGCMAAVDRTVLRRSLAG